MQDILHYWHKCDAAALHCFGELCRFTRSTAPVTCLVMQQKAACVKTWRCHELHKGQKLLFKQKTEARHAAEIRQLQTNLDVKRIPVPNTRGGELKKSQ